MKRHSLFAPVCTPRSLTRSAIASLIAFVFGVSQALTQEPPSVGSTSPSSIAANLPSPVSSSNLAPAAYIHYLLALRFATDGIKHEALREAAASLRVQREQNPAAALAFQLIAEQRQNVHVRLCCTSASILFARYSVDGSRIMTVLDDKTISVWDAHTGKQTAGPMQHEADILGADWSTDGRRIVTSSRDASVHLWDASTGQLVRASFRTAKPLSRIALSPDGRRVLGSAGGEVYLLNAITGEALLPMPRYHDDINAIAWSNDGKYALIGTDDDFAELINPITGKRQHRLAHGNAVFSAVFSSDNRFVLTGSEDHTAKIWDASSGMQQSPNLTQTASIVDAVFSPDATHVLTMSYDHTARVWDARTGHALTPSLQHSAPLMDGGFSADASLVFTRGRDQSIRVWSAVTGEEMMLPIQCSSGVNGAEFSPTDPSLLVTNGNSAEILDMPPSDVAPLWLADLAEFTASRSRLSQIAPPDPSRVEKLRADLLASKADDAWTRFGRWYFSPPDQRAVSPWSKLSLQQYVDQLLALNTKESLNYARQLTFDHPAWALKIDAAQKALLSKTSQQKAKGEPSGGVN